VLRIDLTAKTLRLEVENAGTAGAVTSRSVGRREGYGGYGLELVELLTTRWGISRDHNTRLVARLARAHASGGHVIERAAIIAEGADSQAVITWIIAHGGIPEAAEATSRRRGLHGALRHAGGGSDARNPSRFILPASTFC
jgi:hypothetical protein